MSRPNVFRIATRSCFLERPELELPDEFELELFDELRDELLDELELELLEELEFELLDELLDELELELLDEFELELLDELLDEFELELLDELELELLDEFELELLDELLDELELELFDEFELELLDELELEFPAEAGAAPRADSTARTAFSGGDPREPVIASSVAAAALTSPLAPSAAVMIFRRLACLPDVSMSTSLPVSGYDNKVPGPRECNLNAA
jgi:hypothetical protein